MQGLAELARRELQASPGIGGKGRFIGVDDGVGQSADAGDDGQGAVTQGAELGEATGLEAGRDQDRVDARLRLMGQGFVVADEAADPARMGRGGGAEPVLKIGLAGAENDELRAQSGKHVEGGKKNVEPLLPGQAADHA
jgi:hypothetical protein